MSGVHQVQFGLPPAGSFGDEPGAIAKPFSGVLPGGVYAATPVASAPD
jgi:hypothetical protein